MAEGVVAVVTGRELAEWTTPLRMAPPIEGLKPTEFSTLPIDKVRFIGDPVVCIVAADRYVAEDAAELIEITYERCSSRWPTWNGRLHGRGRASTTACRRT